MSGTTSPATEPTDNNKLDIEIDDSFPASDPPSTTPVQGPGEADEKEEKA